MGDPGILMNVPRFPEKRFTGEDRIQVGDHQLPDPGILRQAGIAVDFTERRTGAHLKRLFVSGGFARNPGLRAEVKTALSAEPIVVDPWKNMTVRPDALSKAAADAGASFAAATAAALACLEEQ